MEEIITIDFRLSLSWSRDHFNKPSSISPISPQRLAAVSTRGRGGRSFPTRFFVSLRTIVRNCHSTASPPPREGFVNEPRMERDRLKEREGERETTSGEGKLSILSTWAFIDNPMAEGEVKRSGTAYRLDSTRVRRSAFRSLVSSRTRWRIYPFPRRMNSCSFVSKIWGNGVDVVRLTKLNESEKQDNIEFIYIFLFAEAHIYIRYPDTVVNGKWFTNCIRLYINIILRLFKVSTRAKWPHHSDIVYTSIFLYERRINKLHCFPSATQYRKLQNRVNFAVQILHDLSSLTER